MVLDEFIWETIEDINLALAKRLRNVRRRRKISQEKLSELSGVSLGSLKRFETTGNISLYSLTKIAKELGCADEIRNLFTEVRYLSIEEVINEQNK